MLAVRLKVYLLSVFLSILLNLSLFIFGEVMQFPLCNYNVSFNILVKFLRGSQMTNKLCDELVVLDKFVCMILSLVLKIARLNIGALDFLRC